MNFQLRHNLSMAIFIIVIIAFMWLIIKSMPYSFNQSEGQDLESFNEIYSDYIEKINQFALQEFGTNQVLSHFIEASQYYNFKDKPALLINPRVTTYNLKGEKKYILSAKHAHYLETGEVRFRGDVDVSSSDGILHKINTQELLIDTHTDNLIAHERVTYLSENANIVSQGMHLKSDINEMKLTGKVNINQHSGQKILTKNLYIDQSNNHKRYYSKHKTNYLSPANKIEAQGMDMQQAITQLLGKVHIVQNSGSIIDTHNLTLDQSSGYDVYKTKDKIHYQSNVADIRAKSMHYDVVQQKIKFTGDVVGRYD